MLQVEDELVFIYSARGDQARLRDGQQSGSIIQLACGCAVKRTRYANPIPARPAGICFALEVSDAISGCDRPSAVRHRVGFAQSRPQLAQRECHVT